MLGKTGYKSLYVPPRSLYTKGKLGQNGEKCKQTNKQTNKISDMSMVIKYLPAYTTLGRYLAWEECYLFQTVITVNFQFYPPQHIFQFQNKNVFFISCSCSEKLHFAAHSAQARRGAFINFSYIEICREGMFK